MHGGTSEELRRYRVSANVPIEFQLPNMSGRLAITVKRAPTWLLRAQGDGGIDRQDPHIQDWRSWGHQEELKVEVCFLLFQGVADIKVINVIRT